jgi:hypothetical protein
MAEQQASAAAIGTDLPLGDIRLFDGGKQAPPRPGSTSARAAASRWARVASTPRRAALMAGR